MSATPGTTGGVRMATRMRYAPARPSKKTSGLPRCASSLAPPASRTNSRARLALTRLALTRLALTRRMSAANPRRPGPGQEPEPRADRSSDEPHAQHDPELARRALDRIEQVARAIRGRRHEVGGIVRAEEGVPH